MLELYHNDMSTCAQKVRATLAEKDLAWDGHELNLRTGEQHKPQFLKLNPRGVVPVLVHDGNVSSNPISSWNTWKTHFPTPSA